MATESGPTTPVNPIAQALARIDAETALIRTLAQPVGNEALLLLMELATADEMRPTDEHRDAFTKRAEQRYAQALSDLTTYARRVAGLPAR